MSTRKYGFTLIELLMVVLVILMLSALLFRGASLVGDRTLRARAIADVQSLQNALNEYFAEYGTYPPTDRMAYIYEDTSMQPLVFRRAIERGDPPMTDSTLGYDYGLVSHLWVRERGTESGHVDYDNDLQRDIEAKQRWAHYLNSVGLASDADPRENSDYDSLQVYSNAILTIRDPWGEEYLYRSPPPYLSYRLWSKGPDRADGTPDDISNASL